MTLGQLISKFRLTLNDNIAPYLWSDLEIIEYINEAEKEVCERSKLLYCKDLDIGKITTLNNINTYNYSNKFIKIERVLLDNKPLTETNKSTLQNLYNDFEKIEGKPRQYFIESDKIIIFPKPNLENSGKELQLEGFIRPIVELVNNNDEPSIPSEYHNKMMSYVFKLAYEKQDTETFDPNRAGYYELQFQNYFGKGIDANVLRKQGESRARFVKCNW